MKTVVSIILSFLPKGRALHLPVSMHQEVALLLVEVNSRHLSGKVISGLFTDGISQVTNIDNILSAVLPYPEAHIF